MTELIIIKTNNSQPIKKFLHEKNIGYEIYQEPDQKESIFAHYNKALQDKEWEKEARELENAEEEDIINEEW